MTVKLHKQLLSHHIYRRLIEACLVEDIDREH